MHQNESSPDPNTSAIESVAVQRASSGTPIVCRTSRDHRPLRDCRILQVERVHHETHVSPRLLGRRHLLLRLNSVPCGKGCGSASIRSAVRLGALPGSAVQTSHPLGLIASLHKEFYPRSCATRNYDPTARSLSAVSWLSCLLIKTVHQGLLVD
jgi:hypothetical protein